MGLAVELQEARASVARAKTDELEYRNGLNQTVDANSPTTGSRLRDLGQAVIDAQENLLSAERDILDRARAVVAEHDPAYLAELGDAHLLGEVEKHALIGAADRLASR